MNTGARALGQYESRQKVSLASKSAYLEEDLQPKFDECSQEVLIVSYT